MKYLIKKSETIDTNEHDISTFHDYPFSFQSVSLGVSEIHNRYPKTGFEVDKKVDAYWYVEEGSAKVFIDGTTHSIEKGDMIFIPKGEKFFIDTHYLKLVVCSTPAWTPDQHKHIEE